MVNIFNTAAEQEPRRNLVQLPIDSLTVPGPIRQSWREGEESLSGLIGKQEAGSFLIQGRSTGPRDG